MREHAIPQDITGYKFHIVGNMTLKQFAEIAIGVVVAFFIYKTNLYPLIKWPLVLLSASFGAALAFVPFEERPLDHWFTTFFKVLYKPTKFYWKKKSTVPDAFSYEPSKSIKTQVDEVDLTPQRRQRITEYIQSVKSVQPADELEVWEKQRSSQLLEIFEDRTLKTDFSASEKLLQKPDLKVKVRSLIGVEENATTEEQLPEPQQQPKQQIVYSQSQYTTPSSQPQKQIEEYEPVGKNVVTTDEVAQEIEIPEVEKIEVATKEDQAEKESLAKFNGHNDNQQAVFSTDRAEQNSPQSVQNVVRNENLPFPVKPSKPNKIVGMILSQSSDLINGATITLKDSNGNTVSAITSNALGQFFVSSQLNNGTYTIYINKTGLSFSPVQITLDGTTVEPLEIRSDQ